MARRRYRNISQKPTSMKMPASMQSPTVPAVSGKRAKETYRGAREWFSPQELADMRLPGMPTTDRRIRTWAEKNLATTRKKLSGKGIEIHRSALKGEALKALERQEAMSYAMALADQPAESAETAPGGEPVEVGTLMPERMLDASDLRRMDRARARAQALAPLMALPERHRGRRAMAEEIGKSLGVGVQYVYRLEDKYRRGGLLALARIGARADRGTRRVLISAAWEAWCAATLAAWPLGGDVAALSDRIRQCVRAAWVGGSPSASQCWLKATAALGKSLMEEGCPEARVVALLKVPTPRKWLEAEAQHFRVAGRSLRDGKGVYDRHLAPVRRTAAGYRPGDLVCGDISPLDIPVSRPDGSTAYARMISWHDVATNWLWVDLFLVEKGQGVRREHVAASFARMCEQAPFGAPRRLYLDNGSEYKWDDMLAAWMQLAYLTGQAFHAEAAALLPESGRVVRSIPFHPRGKRIEGQFGNLRHWLSWWFGYVGGNRMTKQVANLGEKAPVSDFVAVSDWLQRELADYHVTPQPRAEGMDGMSPQERLEWHLNAGWRPMRIAREALMLAFAEKSERVVRRGAIHFEGRTWVADFLMGLEGRVTVARPKIAGPEFDCLFVFDRSGAMNGAAYPERVFGLLDAEGAKEAGRRRQALKLLLADRIEQAGGPLDEAGLAGFRAGMLGLRATLDQASTASIEVEAGEDIRRMARAAAELTERTRALLTRAEARKQAESLARLAFETEEEAAARALGF
ncbi:MAG TPA: hypothetical protein VNL74_03860 [Methylococcus sp.]|nr:hypothetical protein [Methylococcus sp.]